MPVHRKSDNQPKRKRAPSTTLAGRENQLVSLAVDLAEKQLREGTASSQVITHYLKLGTTVNELEKEKIKYENDLLKAKTESLRSQQRIESLYLEALNAMRAYSGQADGGDDSDD